MRFIWTSSIMLGVAVVAVGCSSVQGAVTSDSEERSLEERVLTSGIGEDADDWISDCMAREGFGDMPTSGTDLSLDPVPGDPDELEVWVTEHGYGILEIVLVQAEATPDQLTEQVAAMDPDVAEAFVSALSACQMRYMSERDADAVSPDVQEAYLRLHDEEIVSDDRYLALEDEWVSCMKAKGFDYQDQREPKDYFSQVAGESAGDPTQLELEFAEEKRVALEDLRCRAPLEEQFDAIVAEYEDRFEQTYADELDGR